VRAKAPAIADHLDYERLELVKPTFLLDDWRRRDNDLLIRIPFRDPADGREVLLCTLIEHQSTTDQVMPLRLLVYAVLYWEKEWKAWEDNHPRGQPLRLTPVLPLVLHTGQDPWDSNRNFADLFDVPEALREWLPKWTMPLWDLPEHTPEELLQSGEAFWQALAVARAEFAPADDFMRVFEESLRRLEPLGLLKPVHWHQLLRFVFYWAAYRRPRPEHAALLDAAKASQTNVKSKEEVQKMSQQLWKTAAEEWFEEGEAKGEIRSLRTTLQQLLQKKFRQLPDDVLQRIAAADLDRLQAAVLQVLDIQSLDELQL